MSEIDPTAPPRPSELDVLKQRAAAMGISHSNNIGVDALKAKIQAKLDGTEEEPEKPAAPQPNAFEAAAMLSAARSEERDALLKQADEEVPERPLTLREYMLQEEMKLMRCQIVNLDPKKKDLPGEIITVANEHLGTVRKFVPYGEATDEGYHIPKCIYTFLKDRRFLNITLKKNKMTKTNDVTSRYVPEFSIVVMDPLTDRELGDLRRAQLAIGSVDGSGDDYMS